MVHQYPYNTRQELSIVENNHIYGYIAISLLFYDNQDTEYESIEIEIGVDGPIFTQKKIKGSTGQRYPYPTICEQNIVAIHHIYGSKADSYYFVITKTLNLSHMKNK